MDGATVVVVVSGGEPPHPAVAARLPADPHLVVAADSGLDHALALGLHVDVVVGDLDSVSAEGLARAEAARTRVERHPQAKDHTDLELALERAVELGATEVVAVVGVAGRFDHTLAGALLLAADRWSAVGITAWMGTARVAPVRPARPLAVEGRAGQLLTLLAVGGPATGVTTTGLRWRLEDATLRPGSTRGVSNELAGGPATVAVAGGVLLAILPDELGQP